MSAKTRRRTAALLEVLGIYLTGAFLSDQVVTLLRPFAIFVDRAGA
jgi:hypothetical protein